VRLPPREDLVVLLVVWVVPLLVTAALLWSVGLRLVALSLLAVEVVVGLAVAVARSRGAAERRERSGDGPPG
jgi:hypothetical protein